MKRFLILTLIIILSGCASKAPPKNSSDVCKIFKEKYSWYKAAKKTEKRWTIPVSVSMAIIKQESSFIADARPQRTKLLGFIPWKRVTSARGYAQAVDGTWEMYLKDRGGFFVARNAYHEGRGGYKRGSYRTKPWLLAVADKVQRQADLYDVQYQGCKKKLGKRFIFF